MPPLNNKFSTFQNTSKKNILAFCLLQFQIPPAGYCEMSYTLSSSVGFPTRCLNLR